MSFTKAAQQQRDHLQQRLQFLMKQRKDAEALAARARKPPQGFKDVPSTISNVHANNDVGKGGGSTTSGIEPANAHVEKDVASTNAALPAAEVVDVGGRVAETAPVSATEGMKDVATTNPESACVEGNAGPETAPRSNTSPETVPSTAHDDRTPPSTPQNRIRRRRRSPSPPPASPTEAPPLRPCPDFADPGLAEGFDIEPEQYPSPLPTPSTNDGKDVFGEERPVAAPLRNGGIDKDMASQGQEVGRGGDAGGTPGEAALPKPSLVTGMICKTIGVIHASLPTCACM